MIPDWLHELSIAYLALGATCSLMIALDLIRHPQHMWIMNIVWPVTALFGTVWIVRQYFTYGRLSEQSKAMAAKRRHESPPNRRLTPFRMMVANGTLHCGAGCTLGDIAAEWLVFFVPAVAAAFGWRAIYGERLYAEWIIDFILAYSFGIVFQYFTIAPMRGLPVRRGLIAPSRPTRCRSPHGSWECTASWRLPIFSFLKGHTARSSIRACRNSGS